MGANSSKSSGPSITKHDRAILELKLQRDKIKQYQKKLQIVLDRERALAIEALAAGDKDRAKMALRRRKYQESMLTKTDSQLETLQSLVSTIEFTQIEVSVMHGLAQGNAALKQMQKEMSLEDVEKLMDQTAEAIQYQREVDEMLSSRMTEEEEDAVRLEMAALQREAEGLPPQHSDAVTLPSRLPDAPTADPTLPEVAEPASLRDAELRRPAAARMEEAMLA